MNKLLKNDYFLSFLSKFFVMFFGFVTLMLLNRYLGVKLKGIYSTILNYVTIISAVFQCGVSTVYAKYKRKKIDNCYEIFISLSLLQFILYLFISFITYILLNDYQIFFILLISSISILTTQFRYINLVENIKYNSFVVFAMSSINCILTAIAFMFLSRNLYIGLIIYVLKDITIIILYMFKINYKILFKKTYLKYYKMILVSGFFPMLSGLLVMLNYKIDILMLNTFNIEYSLIGLYSLGLSISEYIWVVPDIFKDVVQKRTAKDNSIDTINFSIRCSSSFVICSYIIIFILNKQIFGLLFGNEYIDAFYVFLILFLGVYSMIYYKIIGQLFIIDNKSFQYFLILLIGVILNIISNYILIPKYNIYGASYASVVSYSIIGIVFLILYKKQYNVRIKDLLVIKKDDIKKFKRFIYKKEN